MCTSRLEGPSRCRASSRRSFRGSLSLRLKRLAGGPSSLPRPPLASPSCVSLSAPSCVFLDRKSGQRKAPGLRSLPLCASAADKAQVVAPPPVSVPPPPPPPPVSVPPPPPPPPSSVLFPPPVASFPAVSSPSGPVLFPPLVPS